MFDDMLSLVSMELCSGSTSVQNCKFFSPQCKILGGVLSELVLEFGLNVPTIVGHEFNSHD